MRDKTGATEFIRKIDRTHPSNTRVVVPKPIDLFLKEPDKIKFIIENRRVIITKVKED